MAALRPPGGSSRSLVVVRRFQILRDQIDQIRMFVEETIDHLQFFGMVRVDPGFLDSGLNLAFCAFAARLSGKSFVIGILVNRPCKGEPEKQSYKCVLTYFFQLLTRSGTGTV